MSRIILIAITILIISTCIPASAVIYVKDHNGPVHDGTSWATAYSRIQDAVNTALPGDEIWVAKGVYRENVVLASGVALYGGFLGTETQRNQRDWRVHTTVLDGCRRGSVVEVAKGAVSGTRIDGFTITNGRTSLGAGIYCNQSANVVIAYNTITSNFAASEGGAVYGNLGSTATIANNRITNNAAVAFGGGIRTTTGTFVITGNVLISNSAESGGAVCCGDSSTATHETIVNNTIFANSALRGGGLYIAALSAASVSNNIVAFNSHGIRKETGSGIATLRSNCVYGNDRSNYGGISAGSTDISVDPAFASATLGNLHIQPQSPCKDRGNNSYVEAGWPDMDGQNRTAGVVDIGADESDGTSFSVTPVTIRVTPYGSDSNDGSGWEPYQAMRTIQGAIDKAASTGGYVWVQAGDYQERITLRDFVYVYGGFAGHESDSGVRDWKSNISRIDAGDMGTAVTARFTGHRISMLDGFIIRGGRGRNGGGVCCDAASPLITNNNITGNTANNSGAGVYLLLSSALIKGNVITGNYSLGFGGGVSCDRAWAEVTANEITDNTACLNGCGIYSSTDNYAVIANNKVVGNREDSTIPGAWGGGLAQSPYSSPDLANNTVAANSAGTNGAIYCGPFGSLNLSNSVVAFNTSGIWLNTASSASTYNCVYSNSSFNYKGVTAGTGDISLDPRFVNRTAGDYHLLSNSPCIDKGLASSTASEDLDGKPRPLDGDLNKISAADMGCYELNHGFLTAFQTKNLPDGTVMAITDMIITADFGDRFYIENPDGVMGVGIQGDCSGTGRSVTVEGTVSTFGGEKMITAYNIIESSAVVEPVPWFMSLETLGGGASGYQQAVTGGHGLNNIGLLVRACGRVVEIDTSQIPLWFKIDDGSGPAVKVTIPSGVSLPAHQDYVAVTGISSCELSGSDLYRLIRARIQNDIFTF